MKKKILFFILVFMFSIINVYAADPPAAAIGTKTYKSIAAAISAAPKNTQTTIILIRDVQEQFTVANDKNIILDLINPNLGMLKIIIGQAVFSIALIMTLSIQAFY